MIRLLVVDDSALMRRLLRDIFAAEPDFTLCMARDGAEALAQIAEFRPDVVTLDINMPGMNGLDCLSRIMVEAPCPVVMVSSLTQQGAETTLEALHLGAVDFVAKPDGTVSLGIERIQAELVAKVRLAAGIRLRGSFRLADRVRHVTGLARQPRRPAAARLEAARLNVAKLQAARPEAAARLGVAARLGAPGPMAAKLRAAKPVAASSGADLPGLVLIGASTGGPRALETVLTGLPGDLAWPVLVAQHMPASFTGLFARRLDAICDLTVSEVDQPSKLCPGQVYIARGGADMILGHRPAGWFAVCAPPLSTHPWHPSVSRLVASALSYLPPERLLGVSLTGMGDDGAAEMAALHAAGGHTIAEDESSAMVWGMPGELVRRGGAGAVLALDRIAGAITALVA
jgi:two-component system chemotaxis response regulator CheB